MDLAGKSGASPSARQVYQSDMAAILSDWADYVESGLALEQPFEIRARLEAATDLMEQVQRLLDDRAVHHAAPVMLAGAALEGRCVA